MSGPRRKPRYSFTKNDIIVTNIVCSSQDVKILPGRDPIKRTQVAHVDFSTRDAAIRASFSIGNIFGLIPDLKLAVPRDED
jgi:hypothetical protein